MMAQTVEWLQPVGAIIQPARSAWSGFASRASAQVPTQKPVQKDKASSREFHLRLYASRGRRH